MDANGWKLLRGAVIIGGGLVLVWMFLAGAFAVPIPSDGGTPGGWLYSYQTLITGLIAIGVGFATVRVIRASIDADDRRAREAADEAYEVLIGQLTEELRIADAYWGAISLEIDYLNETPPKHRALHRTFGRELASTERLAALAETAKRMSVKRQLRVDEVLEQLRLVKREHDLLLAFRNQPGLDTDKPDDLDEHRHGLEVITISLSHLAEAARRADPRLSQIFAKRRKWAVDWTPRSERLHKYLDRRDPPRKPTL